MFLKFSNTNLKRIYGLFIMNSKKRVLKVEQEQVLQFWEMIYMYLEVVITNKDFLIFGSLI